MARPFWLFLLSVAAVVYGSLYPFDFGSASRQEIVGELLASLRQRPSRGDVLANLILYLPIGLFWALAFPNRGVLVRVVLGTVVGTALSVAVEVMQVFDRSRNPSLYDIGFNTMSAAAGALAGHFIGHASLGKGRFRLADPAGALLAACWLAYRLYPYVPTLDWKNVKNAVKPLLTLNLPTIDTSRHLAAWLAFAAIAAANRGGSGLAPLALVGGGVILVRPFLVGRSLQLYEVVGLLLALVLCVPLARRHVLLGVLLLATIVLDGIAPFTFGAASNSFHFVPFIGFVAGNIVVAVQAVLQKVFLYGAAIWLLHRGGWRLVNATALVAASLLAIEIAQIVLPNRTAEVTDPLIAVLLGCMFAFLPAAKRA
jgi:VanZ family protein